jgi:ribosomal 30S subunit maturation factor RimM
VWETGAEAPLLVVRGQGAEALVPLAEAFVKSVDLEARRVVVAWPATVTADAPA